jgi:hypothetical protein
MKGSVYALICAEGVMDWIHGGGHMVQEVYLPELNLCYNPEGGFFLLTDMERYTKATKHPDLEIPWDLENLLRELAATLVAAAELKQQITKPLATLFQLPLRDE